MNTETVQSNWNETKGKIKARFSKLTDENIESLNGSLDQLSSKLMSSYGYAKEHADKEFASFKTSLIEAPVAATQAAPVVAEEKKASTEQAQPANVTPIIKKTA